MDSESGTKSANQILQLRLARGSDLIRRHDPVSQLRESNSSAATNVGANYAGLTMP